MIYFWLFQIHKINGDTDAALEQFSWATFLDPKGATQHAKDLIDRHFQPEENLMVHNDSSLSEDSSDEPQGPFVDSILNLNSPEDGNMFEDSLDGKKI